MKAQEMNRSREQSQKKAVQWGIFVEDLMKSKRRGYHRLSMSLLAMFANNRWSRPDKSSNVC